MAWLQDLIQCLALDVYTLGLEDWGYSRIYCVNFDFKKLAKK